MSHLQVSQGAGLAKQGQAPQPRPSPTVPEATACTWGCGAELSVPLGPSRKVTSPRHGSEPCSCTPLEDAWARLSSKSERAAHLIASHAS